jgi:small subunit ribosomal protein S3Ae
VDSTAKKLVDPFLRKEWYDLRAPNVFAKRDVGKLIVTKSIGKKLARDSLLGRVVEISLGDLKPKGQGEEDAFRKFRLKVEAVQGDSLTCLTNFYGMNLSTDKLRSLVRKWHTLIEAHVDVKTTDGYVLRIFVIGFTKRRQNQHSKTSYAKSAQVRAIRKKMADIVTKEASSGDLSELVKKLILETIGSEIEKATQSIYPLQNVFVRKVKTLKAPKTDMNKLLDLHVGPDVVAETGKKVERDEAAPAAAVASE